MNAKGGREEARQEEAEKRKEVSHDEEFIVQKFTQGFYTGYTIDIYQYYTKQDLKTVLSHEFGHALGIDHLSNPSSIMHETSAEEQNPITLKPSEEDLEALSSVCGISFLE